MSPAFAFAAALIYLPALNTVFGAAPLTAGQPAIAVPFPFVVWGAGELRCWLAMPLASGPGVRQLSGLYADVRPDRAGQGAVRGLTAEGARPLWQLTGRRPGGTMGLAMVAYRRDLRP